MLDQQKDIEAVIVATPDHSHAVIALAAIERGKHVYVQKPLAHSVYEARAMTEAARKHQVVEPDGQPGPLRRRRSADPANGSGAGPSVRCARCMPGPTARVWPQGIEVGAARRKRPPVPASLDWDLWIGPAPYRPYHPGVPSGQTGGRGGTSAPARWATWAATSSTPPSGLSS